MAKKIIKASPDYLPLSFFEFVGHFFKLLTTKKYNHWIDFDNYTNVIGFSCRSLFEICMEYFDNDDIIIATTPLHHTSFRNIIEKFVKPENIHIIKLNKNYNEIEETPQMDKCDLVVITHLFGQDMDLSRLVELKDKHNCLIIEDRVQGGTLDIQFSHEIADIAIYSSGMDKRPVALGGGYMYIRKKHDKLIKKTIEMIDSLPREKRRKRFTDLIKKIPSFLLCNSKVFSYLFFSTIRLFNFFFKKISTLSITKSYRKTNPGFTHFDYMWKPSNALLKSMYKNFDNYEKIEIRFREKYKIFTECFSPELKSYFFPWYKDSACLTPYNTILIEEHLVDQFLEFLSKSHISCISNPTYKLFNFSYENDARDLKFNNGIAYIPSLANMSKKEISFLSNKIKEFYNIISSNKEKKK